MADRPLPDGTRVRHSMHQFPKAYREGTATVIGHFYIGDHLEYRVRRDESFLTDSLEADWQHYYTHPIGEENE